MRFTQYKQPPCKGCKDRVPGCHPRCAKYIEWLTAYREDAAKARKYREAQDFLVSNRLDWAARFQNGIGSRIKVNNKWGR